MATALSSTHGTRKPACSSKGGKTRRTPFFMRTAASQKGRLRCVKFNRTSTPQNRELPPQRTTWVIAPKAKSCACKRRISEENLRMPFGPMSYRCCHGAGWRQEAVPCSKLKRGALSVFRHRFACSEPAYHGRAAFIETVFRMGCSNDCDG